MSSIGSDGTSAAAGRELGANCGYFRGMRYRWDMAVGAAIPSVWRVHTTPEWQRGQAQTLSNRRECSSSVVAGANHSCVRARVRRTCRIGGLFLPVGLCEYRGRAF
eukprot:865222-Prymnesium_polylepis.1